MIVVIGASGFIGTYLVDELLNEDFSVIGTGRNPAAREYYETRGMPLIPLDITNKDVFRQLPREGVDGVILLAALLPANVREPDSQKYIDINISGTLNVLEYCRHVGCKKLISTTTYADVMESWSGELALTEDEPRNFRFDDDHTMYVISKNAAADIIFHYNALYDMQGSVFRLPPVIGYGPHSVIYVNGKYYKSGFAVFLDRAMAGEEIEIYGDASVSRDIVSVKDVCRAFRMAIQSDRAKGLYNVASGTRLTLLEQAETMVKVFSPKGKTSPIKLSPEKPNKSKSYQFDISKAKKDFGFEPIYVPFEKLLLDYKKEMNKEEIPFLG